MQQAPHVRRSHSSMHRAVVRSAVSPPRAPRARKGPHATPRPPAPTGPTATSSRARAEQTAEQKRVANAKRTVPPRRPRPAAPPPPPKPSKEKLRLIEAARRVLALPPKYTETELRAAFRREVKTAHPDQKGDPKRFRVVMSAYRFLRTELGK